MTWLGAALMALQYIMYFCFVDDVLFPYVGRKWPKSKTTCMFHPVRQVLTAVGRQTTLFGWGRLVAAPGAKFAVS